MTLIFDLRTSKCIQLFYLSLSINRLNLKRIGQKTPEKSCNASRTDFQRLSPRDLDLWPMALQMQMNTTFANVYTPAKFHQIGWKMTEKSQLPVFLFWVLVTLTFDLRTPKCIQLFYQSLSIIWPTSERLDDKWQRNRVTQAAVKKNIRWKKKKRQNENRQVCWLCQADLKKAGNSNHKY